MPHRLVAAILVGLVLACMSLTGPASTAAHAASARQDDVGRVAPETLAAMLGKPGVTVIDVRMETDWDESSEKISGAVRESPRRVQVAEWARKYRKDAVIVLYCACPREITSVSAALMLRDELGFSNVRVLAGGWRGWQAAGLPTEPK